VSAPIHDEDWERSLQRLVGKPTVNIEGLVGGYTGPGGKTMLPARAVAKLDLLDITPDARRMIDSENLRAFG